MNSSIETENCNVSRLKNENFLSMNKDLQSKIGDILASFGGIMYNNDPTSNTYAFDCFEMINNTTWHETAKPEKLKRHLDELMDIYFQYDIQDDMICIYTDDYTQDHVFFYDIEQLIDHFPKWIEDIGLYCPSIRNSGFKSVSKCKIMKINEPKEGVAVISYVEYYKNIYSSIIKELNYISLNDKNENY